jgi:hypothetical protein
MKQNVALITLGVADLRLPQAATARRSYRSIRGSPKCGKTLLSANHVIAEIRSPSSPRTTRPYGRAISVRASGK